MLAPRFNSYNHPLMGVHATNLERFLADFFEECKNRHLQVLQRRVVQETLHHHHQIKPIVRMMIWMIWMIWMMMMMMTRVVVRALSRRC
jgi:hypothetical protein